MTEPRPPIHPAPGDWPTVEVRLSDVARLRAELAAANERAETAEQTLLKQPDWERHWQQQVSRREEVQAILARVMLECDSFHDQWQTALRELAKKDAALRGAEARVTELERRLDEARLDGESAHKAMVKWRGDAERLRLAAEKAVEAMEPIEELIPDNSEKWAGAVETFIEMSDLRAIRAARAGLMEAMEK